MIEFKQVSKQFGEIKANNNINFSCDKGTITGLLGVNGAGKSTSLKILSGLLKPDTGDVHINGASVVQTPMLVQQQVGLFLTAQGLYSNLTARENIEFFAALQGLNNSKQASQAVIDRLHLSALADRKVSGFSTGERMKVGLARALVHQPKYLVLDEPSRGLDVLAIRVLREYLLELKSQGCCILFSSHVMQEIDRLCDQVVIINDGQVCFDGELSQLKQSSTDLEQAFLQAIQPTKPLITPPVTPILTTGVAPC
ncbi:hypothetical protein A9Q98_15195 [Thalassotalea sp. 42_200_T64]|nr:hypothetical protein A9Q98_15195 [Thalassotalea sp. 42_200_T64]